MKDYNKVEMYELEQDMITFFHAKEFDLVKYLLTSPDLKRHADINTRHDYIFDHACMNGDLDFIKFILDTPSLERNVSIKDSCIKGIQHCAKRGYLEVFQYFEHHLEREQGFISTPFYQELTHDACAYGQLTTFQYLIEKYTKLTSLTDRNYRKFSKQFQGNDIDLIKYLIFELNIPKNPYAEEMIEKSKIKDEIIKLFELRELNNNLNLELPNTIQSGKKAKL